MSHLQHGLGHYEQSIHDCRQTLEINPYHFGAAAGMGQCYLRTGIKRPHCRPFDARLTLTPNWTAFAPTSSILTLDEEEGLSSGEGVEESLRSLGRLSKSTAADEPQQRQAHKHQDKRRRLGHDAPGQSVRVVLVWCEIENFKRILARRKLVEQVLHVVDIARGIVDQLVALRLEYLEVEIGQWRCRRHPSCPRRS